MTLGKQISRLRAAKGLSQEDLANDLQVSRQSISKWEADIVLPETEKLLMLSEIFGVSLDTLLRDERTLDAMRENPQCGPNAEKSDVRGHSHQRKPGGRSQGQLVCGFQGGG